MRDDFSAAVKLELAKRVGYRCSNPDCRRPTVGPDEVAGTIGIGVAAHICAASPGGPRYDPTQGGAARSSGANGIWLCQTCSRLIDSDSANFPLNILNTWKELAEAFARIEVYGFQAVKGRSFRESESELPELFAEMRLDLSGNNFVREFIVMSRRAGYNGKPGKHVFVYYIDDHENLLGKLKVLCNRGAIKEITFNSVDRFEFAEPFVDYLLGRV